jgi:hypothetical protein
VAAIEPHRTRAGSNLILGRLDKAGCCKQRGRGRAREQTAARADLEHPPRARYMLLGERAGPPLSMPYEISRDRMRSHAIAPDRARPHRTALDRTGPRSTALYTALYRTLPHSTALYRTLPHSALPHRTAPDRTGPHRTAPDRTGPHRTANDRKALTLDTSLQSLEPRAEILRCGGCESAFCGPSTVSKAKRSTCTAEEANARNL